MLDRIKALMAARQLSPSQFADLTTLPRPVVSHILSGRNKPSLEVAQKIMTAFPEVSVDWLLNGRGEMLASAAPPELAPSVSSAPKRPAEPATPRPKPSRLVAAPPAQAAAPAERPPVTAPMEPQGWAAPATAPLEAPAPPVVPVSPPPAAAPAERPPVTAPMEPQGWAAPATAPLEAPAPPVVPVSPPPAAAPVVEPLPAMAAALAGLAPSPAAAPLAPLARPERVVRRILVFYSDGSFSDHRPLSPEENPFL